MKIICISGKAGSGKDYVASALKEKLEYRGNKVLIAHYADLLKYILKTFFQWDGQKNVYGRNLLQHVGTDVIRQQDENYWVNFLKGIFTLFNQEWEYILLPDARFPNEIDVMKDAFHCVSIRINREYESSLTEEQSQHESETALDDYNFDYEFDNNSENIEQELRNCIEFITGDNYED